MIYCIHCIIYSLNPSDGIVRPAFDTFTQTLSIVHLSASENMKAASGFLQALCVLWSDYWRASARHRIVSATSAAELGKLLATSEE